MMVASLSACVNDTLKKEDEPVIPPTPDAKENYYMSVNLYITSSDNTRADNSTTEPGGGSSTGEQAGTTLENTLKSAQLYFCDENYQVLSYVSTKEADNKFTTGQVTDGKNQAYTLEVEVTIEKLLKLVGHEVNLLFVGNNEDESVYVKHNFDDSTNKNGPDAKHTIGFLNQGPIDDFLSNQGGRCMIFANSEDFTIDIFKNITGADDAAKIEGIRALFTENSTNFNGKLYIVRDKVLQLERNVARIDYKDASVSDSGDSHDFTYKIGNSDVKIKLDQMQVCNVNKNPYLFRQTIKGSTLSAFGESGETKRMFGKENDNNAGASNYNWVYGADWTNTGGTVAKTTSYLNELSKSSSGYEITYNNGVTTTSSNSAKGIVSITELAKKTKIEGYYPWRYISENTIPTVDMMSEAERYKYATGVAFKFMVMDKDGANPLEYEETTPAAGSKYPSGITNSQTAGSITITMPNGLWMDVAPEDGKYYLSYYHFIEHNSKDQTSTVDGKTVTVPGPMKYAVVRNNIYRLTVKSISDLPDPEWPDLNMDVYMYAVPWELRIDDDAHLK